MIDRRDFLKISARLWAVPVVYSEPNTWARDAGPVTAAPEAALLPDLDIPFINGALNVPTTPRGPNNRGVITDQTLPGMTHIEIYMNWALMEPHKGAWEMKEFDDLLALSQLRGLKILAFPNLNHAPDWFKESADYQPVVNMMTGATSNFPSPWAPGTYAGFDHFYAYLAVNYIGQIDIIKYFIEVGLMSGTGGSYWCGDVHARDDFRDRMLKLHGDLDRLNAAWGTRFSTPQDLTYPDPPKRQQGPARRWIDFVAWYQDSQVRALRQHLTVLRRHFPKTRVDVPMGFGSEIQSDASDRTAICKAAAEFRPISIRSTHGSFNRDSPPRAYWFYKRMAPMCHAMDIGFGTEPPGGDLTYKEISRQYFEDASAGATLIFHYYQNFHLRPPTATHAQAIADYKRILQPRQRALVDIAVLFPTTQMMMDMKGFPEGQLGFCAKGREHFDYDLVDENMIEWGLLRRYRVLLHTSGTVYRQGTLQGIDNWIRAGGVLVTLGAPAWSTVDAQAGPASQWLARANAPLQVALRAGAGAGVQVFDLDHGSIVVVAAKDALDYLPKAVAVLVALSSRKVEGAPLHGFKPQSDGTYATDFPEGRLVFDTATLATTFHSDTQR